MEGSGSHQTHKSIEHQKHECTAANQKLNKKKKSNNKTKQKKEKKAIYYFFSFFITYKKGKSISRPNINSNNVQIINLELKNRSIKVHVRGS